MFLYGDEDTVRLDDYRLGPPGSAPSVSLDQPSSTDRIAGHTTLAATASEGVVRVDFSVDGSVVASDTTGPYEAV